MGRLDVRAFANAGFDAAGRIRPDARWSSFSVCGLAGLVAGTGWAAVLGYHLGRSVLLVLGLAAAAAGAFVLAVAVRTRLTGELRLVSFQDQLAALCGATVLLILLRQPVPAALDLVAIGVGVVVGFGRMGCLLVGCCHGRPGTWGPRYGQAHVREGFPAEFEGFRMAPVQLFEAIAISGAVVMASAIALRGGARPGSALVLYVLLHVSARFWLEYLRGDERPEAWSVSEAQWTSLAVTAGLTALTSAGVSSVPWWLAAVSLAAMLLSTALHIGSRHRELVSPRHVREVFGVVRAAERSAGAIAQATTRLGIRLSAQHRADRYRHYAFSRERHPLSGTEAAVLGRIVRQADPDGLAVLVGPSGPGGPRVDIYHLSIRNAR